MYENIHKLLCISNDVFVTWQIQGGGVNPNPPLAYALGHSKTLSFLLPISSFFFASWNSTRAVQRLHEFFYNQTCNSDLPDELYWDFLLPLRLTNLTAWLTHFLDIFFCRSHSSFRFANGVKFLRPHAFCVRPFLNKCAVFGKRVLTD